MKEEKDIKQQVLDAMDDSVEDMLQHSDAQLESEVGMETLCDILDLDEAANRQFGPVPDVNAAWDKFSKDKMDEEYEEEESESHPIFKTLLRYIAACAAAILLIVVLMTWNHQQPGQKPLAEVKDSVENQIAKIESPQSHEVSASESVKTIEIKAGEQKTVTLPDGTEVCLNSKSILKYPENFGKDNRNVEFYGEGYFKVHHDANLPFIIRTHSVSTKVLGTEFNLRCYNNEDVHVTLVQGSVEVSLDQSKVRISPKQDAYIENGKVMVQNVNPKDFTSWKDGVLYFDNASLRTILQQLGRVYDVNIVCRDEQLLNKHFHYMCNIKDSLENALKLLNESSEVNVKLQDNVIVIE